MARYWWWLLWLALPAYASWQPPSSNPFASHAAIGTSVAFNAQYLALGAATDGAGKVYIYTHNQPNTPVQVLTLPANVQNPAPHFGSALAFGQVAGLPILAVSAPNWQKNIQDSEGNTRPSHHGRVYLYQLKNQKWQLLEFLDYPHDGIFNPRMGWCLLFAGELLLIATPDEGTAGSSAAGDKPLRMGRLLLAKAQNQATDWQLIDKNQTPSANQPATGLNAPKQWRCDTDLFAYAIAANSTHLFVGAPYSTQNGCGNGAANAGMITGAVYIFDRQNLSQAPQRLLSPYPVLDGQFGSALAVDENHLLVGAMRDTGNATAGGAVYAYIQKDGNWEFAQKIAPQNPVKNSHFGKQIALDGTQLLVGAPVQSHQGYDDSIGRQVSAPSVGAVYYFALADQKWQQRQVIQPANLFTAYQFFGDTLAWLNVAGQKVPLVGSPSQQNRSQSVRGNIGIYQSIPTLNLSARLTSANPIANASQANIAVDIFNPEFEKSAPASLKITLPQGLTLRENPTGCTVDGHNITCAIAAIKSQQHQALELALDVQYQTPAQVTLLLQLSAPPANPVAVDLILSSTPQIKIIGSAQKTVDYHHLPQDALFVIEGEDADGQALHCTLNNANAYFDCQKIANNRFGIFLKPHNPPKDASMDIYVRLQNRFTSSSAVKFNLQTQNIPTPTQPTPPKTTPHIASAEGYFLWALLCLAWLKRQRTKPHLCL